MSDKSQSQSPNLPYDGDKYCTNCIHHRKQLINGKGESTCHVPSNVIGKSPVDSSPILANPLCSYQRNYTFNTRPGSDYKLCSIAGSFWEPLNSIKTATPSIRPAKLTPSLDDI